MQNWTNPSGNTWKTTLPASTQYFENLFYNGVRRLRPRLGAASLGTYYRIASTVYLNAARRRPLAAPNPNCADYFAGSGWECFDRFQYNPADPIVKYLEEPRSARGQSLRPARRQSGAGRRYRAAQLRTVQHLQAAHQLRGHGQPHRVPDRPDRHLEADHLQRIGFIADHRYLVENVQDDLTQPGQWFLDRSTTPWTLTYLANPGENPNTDTVIVPQLAAAAGGVQPAIRDLSGTDL